MKEQLMKAMQRGQLVHMMYMAKDGKISKRRVKVVKIAGDMFQAFCFERRAKRTFITSNVLAIIPVNKKDRSII
nr:transcriptional regulator [Lysinibacillus sp. KH24]